MDTLEGDSFGHGRLKSGDPQRGQWGSARDYCTREGRSAARNWAPQGLRKSEGIKIDFWSGRGRKHRKGHWKGANGALAAHRALYRKKEIHRGHLTEGGVEGNLRQEKTSNILGGGEEGQCSKANGGRLPEERSFRVAIGSATGASPKSRTFAPNQQVSRNV